MPKRNNKFERVTRKLAFLKSLRPKKAAKIKKNDKSKKVLQKILKNLNRKKKKKKEKKEKREKMIQKIRRNQKRKNKKKKKKENEKEKMIQKKRKKEKKKKQKKASPQMAFERMIDGKDGDESQSLIVCVFFFLCRDHGLSHIKASKMLQQYDNLKKHQTSGQLLRCQLITLHGQLLRDDGVTLKASDLWRIHGVLTADRAAFLPTSKQLESFQVAMVAAEDNDDSDDLSMTIQN